MDWKIRHGPHVVKGTLSLKVNLDQCRQPWAFIGPGMRKRLIRLVLTIYNFMKFLLSMVDAVLT
jgi:hypothetical protein